MNCMKLICLVLLATTLVLAQESYDFSKEKKRAISIDSLLAYNKWKFNNRRAYLSEEEQSFRQFIFFDNFKKIQELNNDPNATYQADINQFADMTQEEFESKMLNNALSETYQNYHVDEDQEDEETEKRKLQTLPTSVDWRTKGVVTPVKNQGACSSCYTFSATGVLEAVNVLRGKPLTSFSEQQLLDCCTKTLGYNCQGCNGGWPNWTLDYVKKYGILTQSQYPYIGSKGTCKVTTPSNGFYISSYSSVAKSVSALKAAVAKSPVSIAIEASYWSTYKSGIFNRCSADPNKVNHAVLLVGYTAAGEWIVKNSWGASWGEQGYVRLSPGNTCGVYNYAVVAKI